MFKRYFLSTTIGFGIATSYTSTSIAAPTLFNNSAQLDNPVIIDFDSSNSDTINELSSFGISVNSLDSDGDPSISLAKPFISNLGGPGVGTLSSNALGNNRIGQFSFVNYWSGSLYSEAAIRSFEIVFANPVTAFGFAVQGWQGVTANHLLSAYDTSNVLLGTFSFSSALIPNDTGFNGFIGISGNGQNLSRVLFTPQGADEFIAFDNFTFQRAQTIQVTTIPESGSVAAILGIASAGLFTTNKRKKTQRNTNPGV